MLKSILRQQQEPTYTHTQVTHPKALIVDIDFDFGQYCISQDGMGTIHFTNSRTLKRNVDYHLPIPDT